jgi:hypothetical protein
MLDQATIERLESIRDGIIETDRRNKAAVKMIRNEVDLDDVDIWEVAGIYFREVSR